MKREEAMKNLWTKSTRNGASGFIHIHAMDSGAFAPISNRRQGFDPMDQSGVIPLRTSSY